MGNETEGARETPHAPLTLHEAAAVAMALGGEVDGDAGNAIPQEVWTSLYDRRLLRLESDIEGERYCVVTETGSAALIVTMKEADRGE